jgi:hypothetical protein
MVNRLGFGFKAGPIRPRSLGKALLLHLVRLAHERGCGRME